MDYYNEIDPFAAKWLRNLIAAGEIPPGEVDERSIADVRASEFMGCTQRHFFAGIGGWPLALKLAGWPQDREVWTGSCPCQPLSCAGKRGGEKDVRHLWPEFYRLIRECRPAIVFGEQVASNDGLEWFDGVSLDLEELGYAVGSADLPAACVGAPHRRQRLFWVAVADETECGRRAIPGGRQPKLLHAANRCGVDELADAADVRSSEDVNDSRERARGGADNAANGSRLGRIPNTSRQRLAGRSVEPTRQEREAAQRSGDDGVVNLTGRRLGTNGSAPGNGGHADEPGGDGALGDGHGIGENAVGRICQGTGTETARGGWDGGYLEQPVSNGQRGQRQEIGRAPEVAWSGWSDFSIIPSRDNKSRRVSAQPGDEPLAPRIPRDLGRGVPELASMARHARANRVGRLKGYGNAIVPQAAAVFIRAVMEAINATSP